MKKWIARILLLAMLCSVGCSGQPEEETLATSPVPEGNVTEIAFAGQNVSVNGRELREAESRDGVCLSRDIIYYEDRDTYESGNPYGEGEAHERHSAREAENHLVVNITQPGNYRVTGSLEQGQIRVDLGENAFADPGAVVNLILDGTSINCTVAPAILFLNVYECDGSWSTETAAAEVDTTAAGANLILAPGSENVVYGSHVARIYKDKEGEKKLWKQDGAIYSYMSMNVAGDGSLDLYADNEGLDTELHLTINGGNLNIRSDNDGINTNEDGVSVTTINGGNIHIIAGLGAEGDGIDSNGYLVINGGTVVASANPAADAGLDSDLGSYINGGTVVALGSTMDWAESDSDQVTMNLQFARMQSGGSSLLVLREDGSCVFAYDPGADEVQGENVRQYMGAVVSCGSFQVGESYSVWVGSRITGSESGGVFDASTVTGYEGGARQAYTGTDVMEGPGGFGGGRHPDGMGGRGPEPEGEMPSMPEDWTMPEGEMPTMPEDWMMPEGEMPSMPEDWTMPEGEIPPGGFGGPDSGQRPDGMGGPDGQEGKSSTLFYMQDKVNFFSGLTEAE